MCIRIVERYAVCKCVYYVHGIDQCNSYGMLGHPIQDKVVLVGHTCPDHTHYAASSSSSSAGSSAASSYYGPQYTGTGGIGGQLRWQQEQMMLQEQQAARGQASGHHLQYQQAQYSQQHTGQHAAGQKYYGYNGYSR